jgi:hypothetical protein
MDQKCCRQALAHGSEQSPTLGGSDGSQSKSKYFAHTNKHPTLQQDVSRPCTGLKKKLDFVRKRRRATSRRGIIIGQAPNRHSPSAAAPVLPLQGLPEKRLARLAGLEISALWATFDRTNLLGYYPGCKSRAAKHSRELTGYSKHYSNGDIFPMEEARRSAAEIKLEDYSLVVLLGLSVARAFEIKAPAIFKRETRGPCMLLVLPHPSGVSHFWNEPSNIDRAANELREAMDCAFGSMSTTTGSVFEINASSKQRAGRSGKSAEANAVDVEAGTDAGLEQTEGGEEATATAGNTENASPKGSTRQQTTKTVGSNVMAEQKVA